MRKNALIVFTTATLAAIGYMLSTVAAEFQHTYSHFGMAAPKVTTLLLLSIPLWKYILGAVSLLSYAPIVMTDGKLKYLSIAIPMLCFFSILAALYLPIFLHGPVI